MRTVATGRALRAELAGRRAATPGGTRVAFVPTMGALHDGHLARYPRDPAGDAAKAAGRGVDVLFTPDVVELYPREPRVRVAPGPIAARWEGAVRPGHFAGVLTVVAKLFHLVRPDVAVFGQKDAQQVAVVRAMLEDLDFGIELAVVPTARESDGLARSSRNAYLDDDGRRRAAAIPRALADMERAFDAGQTSADALARLASNALRAGGDLTPDYVAVTDPATLEPVERATAGTLVMVAARVGPTRLLDTIVLGDARYGTGSAATRLPHEVAA